MVAHEHAAVPEDLDVDGPERCAEDRYVVEASVVVVAPSGVDAERRLEARQLSQRGADVVTADGVDEVWCLGQGGVDPGRDGASADVGAVVEVREEGHAERLAEPVDPVPQANDLEAVRVRQHDDGGGGGRGGGSDQDGAAEGHDGLLVNPI